MESGVEVVRWGRISGSGSPGSLCTVARAMGLRPNRNERLEYLAVALKIGENIEGDSVEGQGVRVCRVDIWQCSQVVT